MEDIQVRTLRCGMTLIVEHMSGVRSAAATWLLPAGSATDPADRQGRSTLWAELLMRGAGERDSRKHADAVDRLGASRSCDLGTLTMRVAAAMLGDRVREVLPLLADMVLRPRMDEAALAPTKDLAIQAIESLKDDPQERAMLLARLRHHPEPINRSGLGTIEGIHACTRQELLAGWHQLARPGRSVIALAGDVDADEVQPVLERLLEEWGGDTPEPAIGPTPQRGYAHEEDPSTQVQIVIACDAPSEKSPESVLEKLAVSVLSGGMSGRLFSELREKRGLCYSVSAGYRGDRDYGVVTAYVGTTPERAQESLDVLLAELRRITTPQGGVTQEEFDRARVGMKSGLVFSGESSAARAGALAVDYRRLGRPRSLDEVALQIDAVTLDQLNAHLGKRELGRVTIQTLGPAALRA